MGRLVSSKPAIFLRFLTWPHRKATSRGPVPSPSLPFSRTSSERCEPSPHLYSSCCWLSQPWAVALRASPIKKERRSMRILLLTARIARNWRTSTSSVPDRRLQIFQSRLFAMMLIFPPHILLNESAPTNTFPWIHDAQTDWFSALPFSLSADIGGVIAALWTDGCTPMEKE